MIKLISLFLLLIASYLGWWAITYAAVEWWCGTFLLAACAVARGNVRRDKVLRECPVERILAEASTSGPGVRGLCSRFGRWASEEDLHIILEHLSVESDPETCLHLLWVFRRAKLPRMDARVWALANDNDPRLRAAAARALSSLSDPRIGELGRQRLQGCNFSAEQSDEIDLFVNNYQTGDEALLLAALQRLSPTDVEAHSLGMSALRVCAHNDFPALAGIAQWIYETNPCTICRKDAVETLLQWEHLRAHIAEECLHDASDDIRALANGLR